jgi:talin
LKLIGLIQEIDENLKEYVGVLQSHIVGCNSLTGFRVKKESEKLIAKVSTTVNQIKEIEKTDPEITNAIQSLEQALKYPPEQLSWFAIGSILQISGKNILSSLNDSAANSVLSPAESAKTLSDESLQIIKAVTAAMENSKNDRIKDDIQALLDEFAFETLNTMRAFQQNRDTPAKEAKIRSKLIHQSKQISKTLNGILTLVNGYTTGVKACTEVTGEIHNLIDGIDSQIEFANAKQLKPITDFDSYENHKDGLEQATLRLAKVFQSFSDANRLNQDTLSTLAIAAGDGIKEFVIRNNQTAASIGNDEFEIQAELLQSAKEVANAMQTILDATKRIAGTNDEVELQKFNNLVKDSSEMCSPHLQKIEKVQNFIKRKGFLESFKSAVDSANETLKNNEPALGTALPIEVVENCNQLTKSMGNLISNGGLPNEQYAPLLGTVQAELLNLTRSAKSIAVNLPEEDKSLIIQGVSELCAEIVRLTSHIQNTRDKGGPFHATTEIQEQARQAGNIISGIVTIMSEMVPEGYVDPNDPNVIAERELLSAANAIEAAARRLVTAAMPEKPRPANEDLKFEDQIVEAARAIAAASSALVRSATGAQREIIAKGNIGTKQEAVYFSDGTWSEGLVSAAKFVVATTNDLCESANEFVKLECTLEKVIVSSKNVSAATVQLLAAAQVRADPNSKTQLRLRAAGKAVTDATEQLVISSKNARPGDTDNAGNTLDITPTSLHRAKIMEMEIQMKILRLEKELEEARASLASIRKKRYDDSASHELPKTIVPKHHIQYLAEKPVASPKSSRVAAASSRSGPKIVPADSRKSMIPKNLLSKQVNRGSTLGSISVNSMVDRFNIGQPPAADSK